MNWASAGHGVLWAGYSQKVGGSCKELSWTFLADRTVMINEGEESLTRCKVTAFWVEVNIDVNHVVNVIFFKFNALFKSEKTATL